MCESVRIDHCLPFIYFKYENADSRRYVDVNHFEEFYIRKTLEIFWLMCFMLKSILKEKDINSIICKKKFVLCTSMQLIISVTVYFYFVILNLMLSH